MMTSYDVIRYEKMAEQEEMANQQQRKRLYQEVQLKKERLSSTFQQKQKEMEQHFANMEVDKRRITPVC